MTNFRSKNLGLGRRTDTDRAMKSQALIANEVAISGFVSAQARQSSGARTASLDLARFVMALAVIGAHGRLFVDLSYPVYSLPFRCPEGWGDGRGGLCSCT